MRSRTWLTILIIIILAVLAYFVYSYRNVLIPSGAESVINKLDTQSQSDTITDIESDLRATEFQELDSELSDIESELQNAGL